MKKNNFIQRFFDMLFLFNRNFFKKFKKSIKSNLLALPSTIFARQNSTGFTLIELLVVVVIISVLTSVGAVSYNAANKKSRDGKRKADIEQIRAALEMYRTDNSSYPVTGGLSSLVSGDYIQSLPEPPVHSTCNSTSISSYDNDCVYVSDGNTYTIKIDLETDASSYSKTNP